MKELSLNMLDIVQNSIRAGATKVEMTVVEDSGKDAFSMQVCDDGCGMDEVMAKRVSDPFVTTRTTRTVGLGVPMFFATMQQCEGDCRIDSAVGKGTCIVGWCRLSHIDRPPLGDMGDTVVALILANPDIDFVYEQRVDSETFRFDTREVREVLGEEVPLNVPDVVEWIRSQLGEGIATLNGRA